MTIELRLAGNSLMAVARRTWAIVAVSRILIVALTIVAILERGTEEAVATVVALLFVTSELADVYATAKRDRAEDVKRRADFLDSFGWRPAATEAAELELALPLPSTSTGDSVAYFTSTQPPGDRRAIENLRESSWWTAHLAKSAWRVTIALVSVLCAIVILLLAMTAASASTHDARMAIARAVMTALLAALTIGAVRALYGFNSLMEHARDVENGCEAELRGTPDTLMALRLWSDYHVFRAQAPVVPAVLWRVKRASLKRAWEIRSQP